MGHRHNGRMPRELRTAEEIRDEVARILNLGRKVPLQVPLPLRLAFEADTFIGGGANWQMPAFPKVRGNEAAIGRSIMTVKMKWDLA